MKMSPGWWMVYTGTIYLVAGFVNLFYKFSPMEILQAVYVVVLSLPLWVPPISRWVGVKLFWRM